jgi:hypothetical protein
MECRLSRKQLHLTYDANYDYDLPLNAATVAGNFTEKRNTPDDT